VLSAVTLTQIRSSWAVFTKIDKSNAAVSRYYASFSTTV
jgi:hypothetical protein